MPTAKDPSKAKRKPTVPTTVTPNTTKRHKVNKSAMGRPVASPSQSSYNRGSPIYTVRCKQGIMVAYTARYNDPDQMAFVSPIRNKIESNEEFANDVKVFAVMPRRNPDGTDTTMTFSTLRNPNKSAFLVFVRVLDDPDDNTLQTAKLWGAQLAKRFTDIGQSEFRYPASFHYAGDLTNHDVELDPSSDESVLPPPAKYLRDFDVLTLMDTSYPVPPFTRQEQVATLANDYFGPDHPTAEDLILHAPVRSDASKVE